MFGPEKMPADRVAKVAAALNSAMQLPVVVEFHKGNTNEVDFKGPAEFKAFLVKASADWAADVKKANVKIE